MVSIAEAVKSFRQHINLRHSWYNFLLIINSNLYQITATAFYTTVSHFQNPNTKHRR